MLEKKMICVGGPYGAASSRYRYALTAPPTFRQFAELILSDEREWGYFFNRLYGDILAEYSHGKIKYFIDDVDFEIEPEGIAHGGWSRMDYVVNKVEKESRWAKAELTLPFD